MGELEEIKHTFARELEGVSDLNELKRLYALEIARKDKLIDELQAQNQVLLKSMFKVRSEETK